MAQPKAPTKPKLVGTKRTYKKTTVLKKVESDSFNIMPSLLKDTELSLPAI